MKDIVFLGDSYTWGQGLYYYKWISENRKFNKKINGVFSSHSEFITNDDLNFKNSLSFTNLVSSHLNLKCIKIGSNGGSHQSNIAFYKELLMKSNIKYVIFQLSSFARDMTDFVLTNVDFNIRTTRGRFTGGFINFSLIAVVFLNLSFLFVRHLSYLCLMLPKFNQLRRI